VERWKIPDVLAGRYRRHINFGGRGYWCMFDYTARPASGLDTLMVEVAEGADADTARWFPHLKRGMESGWRVLQDHYGRLLVGVRVEVTKVYAHLVDTTPLGCERYGSEFIEGLGRFRAVPATTEEGLTRAEPQRASDRGGQ
jgi:hypothetical protein